MRKLVATSESATLSNRELKERSSSAVIGAMLLGCVVLAAAGCGASGRTPTLSRHRLNASATGQALAASFSRAAEHALRTIAKTMRAPRFSSDGPVHFGNVQYQLITMNSGLPHAFTADQVVEQTWTVRPDSSASLGEEVLRSPQLRSEVDRLQWQAAGRPHYVSRTDHAGMSVRRDVSAGAFSFTPQGRVLTFKRVRMLPTAPSALAAVLGRLLSAAGPATPPAAMSLRQYGFVLATAPLTPAARRAILEAMAALPGIHMCGSLFPAHPRHDEAFCVNGDPTNTEILLHTRTGVVVVVRERSNQATRFFPNVPGGSLISSYIFSSQPPTS
jgi:hypothetical protein